MGTFVRLAEDGKRQMATLLSPVMIRLGIAPMKFFVQRLTRLRPHRTMEMKTDTDTETAVEYLSVWHPMVHSRYLAHSHSLSHCRYLYLSPVNTLTCIDMAMDISLPPL